MRSSLLATLVLVVTLVLAACGGGGDGDSATTGAADTGIAAPVETETAPETVVPDKPFQIKVPASAPIGPTSPPKVIMNLQRALKMLAYDVGTPDGVWGAKTRKAVIRFQRKQKLEADGLVGAQTAKAINRALANRG